MPRARPSFTQADVAMDTPLLLADAALGIPQPCLHFVWFRGDEFARACRIFGRPDFIHPGWDQRARREIAPGDMIVFARGEHDQKPASRNFSDIVESANEAV